MCTNNNIYQTQTKKHLFSKKDLDLAINDYLQQNSATLKSTYDKAIKSSKKSKYGPKEVLQALLRIKKEEVNSQELLSELRKKITNYPSSTLTTYLNQLISSEREEVLRLNQDSNTYFFSNPFQKAFIELSFSKELQTESIGSTRISPDELLAFIQAKREIQAEFVSSDEDDDFNDDLDINFDDDDY
jgi:hypothetical protein